MNDLNNGLGFFLKNWIYFIEKILKKVPEWKDVQKALDLLIKKEYIDCNKDTEVFDEFSLISSYITLQKVTEWNNLNVSTEIR